MSWAPARSPDSARRRSAWLPAAVAAVVAPGVATGIGLALGFENRPGPAGLYLLAVLLTTYACGVWAGLAATALSVVGFAFFFLTPTDAARIDGDAVATLIVFALASLLAVAVVGRERRVARALRESERRLELALEETETGFWIWYPSENRFTWSPNLGPMFGLPRGAQPESLEDFAALVHPQDARRVPDAERLIAAGEAMGELEFRIVTPSGETRWIWNQATAERDRDGGVLRVLGLTRDVTERRRRADADRFLAEASELLGRSLEIEETLASLAQLAVPRLADWCVIELLESKSRPAFTTIAHPDPDKVALVRELRDRSPPDELEPGPRRAALTSGRAQLLADVPDGLLAGRARDDRHLAVLRSLGLRSAVVVPIPGVAGPVGLVTLIDAESGRRFDELELSLAEELARRAGDAIANADLHAAERQARDAAEEAADRTSRLQRVTAALAAATTPGEIAEALVSLGTPAFHGAAAWVGYLSEDGRELVRAAETEWPPEFASILSRVALDGLPRPTAEAATTGRPVWVASSDELQTLYPEIAEPYRQTGFGAVAVVPIPVRGKTAGVVLVSRPLDKPFSALDRAFLLTLGALAGQALERARAHAAETEIRQGIERVLDVAPAWLTGSREEVARAICASAIESFAAPVCHLFDVRGDALRLIWREPASPDQEPGLELPLSDLPGIEEALTALRTTFVGDVLAGGSRGDARAHALATGLRSSLWIPVSVGGRATRVLILSWSDVVEEPRTALLAVIRRFADQAALALERAERLEAEAAAARSAGRLRRLQSVTASLATSASVQDIARTVLEHLESFGGRAGTVAAVRDSKAIIEIVEASGYPRDLIERFRRIPLDASNPIAEAIRTRETVVVATIEERDRRYPATRGLPLPAPGPLAVVPLLVGDRAVGAITVRFEKAGELPADDLALIESIAGLAAQAVERARLYEREQAVAATLQRSVLPDAVPRLDPALVAARYLPGSAGLEVGGDWYDVVRLMDEQVVLAVGDVVGKGVGAASTMAQLRNALRAYALEGFGTAAVVGRLNRIAELTELHFATLLVAMVDLRTGECRFTSAGHLPPLVVPADDEAFFAEGGGSLPLGVSRETAYEQGSFTLAPGATIVVYTDGLVESRELDLSTALENLRSRATNGRTALEPLVDRLIEPVLGSDLQDDVAVLALRLLETPSAGLWLSLPAAYDSLLEIRTAVLAWLDTNGCEPEVAHEIGLGCWELCVNAIEHALDSRRATIEVTGELVQGTIALTVRDHGGWREPRARPERGLGLRLAAGLSDEIAVRPGLDGTRVTLTRRLGSTVSG